MRGACQRRLQTPSWTPLCSVRKQKQRKLYKKNTVSIFRLQDGKILFFFKLQAVRVKAIITAAADLRTLPVKSIREFHSFSPHIYNHL